MPRRHAAARSASLALVLAAVAAPAASARPAPPDPVPAAPAVSLRQDLRSADAVDAATGPARTQVVVTRSVRPQRRPVAATGPRPLPARVDGMGVQPVRAVSTPAAPAPLLQDVGTSGLDWLSAGLGAGAVLVLLLSAMLVRSLVARAGTVRDLRV